MVEGLGVGILLVVLVLVVFIFGTRGAFLLDDTLHHSNDWRGPWPGLELMIVPATAIGAARWRWGAERILALRINRAEPWIPLLMAAALVGLIAYLVWSWDTSLNNVGPDEFGLVRWLGTALAAILTVVGLPLFPRFTATLVGMIAGSTLFGLLGYTFFGSHMEIYEGTDGPIGFAFLFSMIFTSVWVVGAALLSRGARPLFHAMWSGVVMLALAAFGHLVYGVP